MLHLTLDTNMTMRISCQFCHWIHSRRLGKHYISGTPSSSLQYSESPRMRDTARRERAYTLTKRRCAHIVGVAPDGGPTPLESHALLVQIRLRSGRKLHETNHRSRRAQRVQKDATHTVRNTRGTAPQWSIFHWYLPSIFRKSSVSSLM